MIIALDVEGTLISNAVSQIPRPGLYEFLEACADLGSRVVVYTSVPEPAFRTIAAELTGRGEAPPWFADAEYVTWSGRYKRLHVVPGTDGADVLLLDDMEAYVHPDDRDRWIPIEPFQTPYAESDRGLREALAAIQRRLDAA